MVNKSKINNAIFKILYKTNLPQYCGEVDIVCLRSSRSRSGYKAMSLILTLLSSLSFSKIKFSAFKLPCTKPSSWMYFKKIYFNYKITNLNLKFIVK